MALKQAMVIIAVGAALAIIMRKSKGPKGGEDVPSEPGPIEGVGTAIS